MAKSDHDPSSTPKSTEKNPRRWSLDDAKRVLTEFEASGLTLTAFAAREGLQLQRLYKWRQRMSEEVAPLKFAEVPLSGTSSAASVVFEVVLRNGRLVRIGASFDAAALRRLLSVVDGEPAC